jgi:hypothetical protein
MIPAEPAMMKRIPKRDLSGESKKCRVVKEKPSGSRKCWLVFLVAR